MFADGVARHGPSVFARGALAPAARGPRPLAPEITRRERRAYVLVIGLLNLAFMGVDLLAPWPNRPLVVAGRGAISIILLVVSLAAGRDLDHRRIRRLVRVGGVALVVAFDAVVQGTGGYAGPMFPFFGVLPIVFMTVVPDDVVAALVVGLASMALGVGGAAWRGVPPEALTFWAVAFLSATAYAAAGAYLHLRMRRREARAFWEAAERTRDRERAEAARASLSSRLEAIRSQVNDILLLVTPTGHVVQANDRALDAYGYTREEMTGLDIRRLRASATLPEIEGQLRRACSGEGFRFRTVHRRSDDSTFPVEVSTRAISLDGATLLQSIVRDLSEEQAARAALEYRAMLLDNLQEAVVGMDVAGVVTAWNPAAERTFGCPRAEAVGRPFAEVLESEYADGSSHAEVLARVAVAGRVRLEVRRRPRAGGEWIDVDATAVALFGPGGALIGYVSVNRDVTQARRTQAALRAAQERLERILETSRNGIWIVDAEGRTEFMNATAAELFSTTPEAALGRPAAELVPEELRAAALEDLEALRRGDRVERELRLRPAAGGPDRQVVVSGSVLRSAAGRVDGAVGMFVDVTALRQAEEELHQAQKLEAIGRLAAGIAHEINTPLQYIGHNTQFLGEAFAAMGQALARARALAARDAAAGAELDRLADELDLAYVVERAPQTIERTMEGVRRVSTIVRAMKEFAHPGPVAMAPADLNRALQATLEVARNEYKYVADVVTDLGDLPAVTCLVGDLNQVFLNVIVNAAHAIEDVVKPTGGRGTIRISTRRDGAEVEVAISDSGGGIPPEVASRIYEPFFTTKAVGRGTGQGLAIARAIVAHHHGRIDFTSTPGQGTTFTIRLPIEPPPAPAAQRDEPGGGPWPAPRPEGPPPGP